MHEGNHEIQALDHLALARRELNLRGRKTLSALEAHFVADLDLGALSGSTPVLLDLFLGLSEDLLPQSARAEDVLEALRVQLVARVLWRRFLE